MINNILANAAIKPAKKASKQASKPGQVRRAPISGNPLLDALGTKPAVAPTPAPAPIFKRESDKVVAETRAKALSIAQSRAGTMENAMAIVDKRLGITDQNDPRRKAIKSALWGTGPEPKAVSRPHLERLLAMAQGGDMNALGALGQSNRTRRKAGYAAQDAAAATPDATGIMGMVERLAQERAGQILDVLGGAKSGYEKSGILGMLGGTATGASKAAERMMPTSQVRALMEGAAGGANFRADDSQSTSLALGTGIGKLGEYLIPGLGAAKIVNDAAGVAGRVATDRSGKPIYDALIGAPIEGVKAAFDPSKPTAERILGGLGAAAMVAGGIHGGKKVANLAKTKGWTGVMRTPMDDPGHTTPPADTVFDTSPMKSEGAAGNIPTEGVSQPLVASTPAKPGKAAKVAKPKGVDEADPNVAVSSSSQSTPKPAVAPNTAKIAPAPITLDAIYAHIKRFDPYAVHTETLAIDWGKSKRLGKRLGAGMVQGSMGAGISGKRTTKQIKWPGEDFTGMHSSDIEVYSQARQAGLTADEAFALANGHGDWAVNQMNARGFSFDGSSTNPTPPNAVIVRPTNSKGNADLLLGEPRKLAAGDLPQEVTSKAKRGVDPYSKIARGEGVQVVEGVSSTDARGLYQHKSKNKPFGEIKLTPNADDVTRAHEVAHAIDAVTSPTGRPNRKVHEILGAPASEGKSIREELVRVTRELIGDAEVDSRPGYYKNHQELWARFLQAYTQKPEIVKKYAPVADGHLSSLAEKHPAVDQYLKVARGVPLEGKVAAVAPTYEQSLKQKLGNYLGGKAWDAKSGYQARRERIVQTIGSEMKEWRKGITDTPDALMTAAEGILSNEGGNIQFGTKDRYTATTKSEKQGYADDGFSIVDTLDDGTEVYERTRWTPEEAKANYERLSPEGKKLIDTYTKRASETDSIFNRERMAIDHKVEPRIEGYVSHVLQDGEKASRWVKNAFKRKEAGFRKKRTGGDGETRDIFKQVEYQRVTGDLEAEFNGYIEKQLARTMERVPMDQKQSPAERKGWTLVEGNLDTGLHDLADRKFKHGATRYWVPDEIWYEYKIGAHQKELTGAAKHVMGAMRYWAANILLHPGSITTNSVSGATQLMTKWIEDSMLDMLGEGGKRNRTASNMKGVLAVLNPRGGWSNTPNWLYGGKTGGMHGVFESEGSLMDKPMSAYSAVEDVFKKAITNASLKKQGLTVKDLEGMMDAKQLDAFDKAVGALMREVDISAYDYTNIPTGMKKFRAHPLGTAIKPFTVYPYKAMKQFIRPFEMLFDENYSPKEKAAALGALAVVMSGYIAAKRAVNSSAESDTRSGDDILGGNNRRLQARGAVKISKEKGVEKFLNVSKYTPLNFAEMLDSLVPSRNKDGEWGVDVDQLQSAITDMAGGVGPLAQAAGEVIGFRSKYDAYKSSGAVLGGATGSFIPFARIQKDINDLIGVKGKAVRKTAPKTFLEALGMNVVGADTRKARVGSQQIPEKLVRDQALMRLLLGLRVNYVDPKEQKAAIDRARSKRLKDEGG